MEELPGTDTLGPVRARQLLAEVTDLRRRGRRPGSLWPPLLVFGIVAVAGAPLMAAGVIRVNVWWLIAAPVGFVAVGVCSARQGRRRGFEARGWRLAALGAASFAVCWLAILLSARAASWPGGLAWALTVAAGYLAWSWFARSLPTAMVAVTLGVTGGILTLASAPAWGIQLGVGLVMMVGGLVLRSGPEAS